MCGYLRSSTAPRRTFWLESNFAASVLLFKRCASSRSPLQRQAVRRPAACLLYVRTKKGAEPLRPGPVDRCTFGLLRASAERHTGRWQDDPGLRERARDNPPLAHSPGAQCN
jgi:hypothetical protein